MEPPPKAESSMIAPAFIIMLGLIVVAAAINRVAAAIEHISRREA